MTDLRISWKSLSAFGHLSNNKGRACRRLHSIYKSLKFALRLTTLKLSFFRSTIRKLEQPQLRRVIFS